MKFNVACIQLTCTNKVEENLQSITDYANEAIKAGADFILTPENSSLFSLDGKELLATCEGYEKNSFIQSIQKLSKSAKKWILIGGMPIKVSSSKLVNRSILINKSGEIVKTYDKMHMFDVVLSSTEQYQESEKYLPGQELAIADLPWGKLGMSICYDLRFPKMYRKMAKLGCIFLSVPSAFTKTTGEKHWHTLLQARAIENFSYVFAPAQTGTHFNKRQTFGHSLIISPDGAILAEKKNGTGFIMAEIDSNLTAILRQKIQSLNLD